MWACSIAQEEAVDKEAQLQEEQYSFPYHYLPKDGPKGFSQVEYWSWGYRYLGRLRIAVEFLERLEFDSLVDIGCGDGRFLHDLSPRFPQKHLLGVDISHRAISWARCMNPDLKFEAHDILTNPLPATYDVATLLDVIEHIPPAQLDDFIKAALGALRPGGWLILTAPHTNMTLDPKHYQHFNPEHLDRLLEGKTAGRQYMLFDGKRWPVGLLLKLMGGSGRHFIVTSRWITHLLYNSHRTWCLRDSHPRRSQRLACLAQKLPAPTGATKSV
jgi:SAM-dependent methyltransferase